MSNRSRDGPEQAGSNPNPVKLDTPIRSEVESAPHFDKHPPKFGRLRPNLADIRPILAEPVTDIGPDCPTCGPPSALGVSDQIRLMLADKGPHLAEPGDSHRAPSGIGDRAGPTPRLLVPTCPGELVCTNYAASHGHTAARARKRITCVAWCAIAGRSQHPMRSALALNTSGSICCAMGTCACATLALPMHLSNNDLAAHNKDPSGVSLRPTPPQDNVNNSDNARLGHAEYMHDWGERHMLPRLQGNRGCANSASWNKGWRATGLVSRNPPCRYATSGPPRPRIFAL